MEIKMLCKEWYEKNKFDCDITSVFDAMHNIDQQLKKAEQCCMEAGLGSIGYIDKTDMIEECHDILNRLVNAVDGIGSYITDQIDAPFKEKMESIYDQAMSMSLDNYTTNNTMYNSGNHGVDSLTTVPNKERITLQDILTMTQMNEVQEDESFLENQTKIYQQQYHIYREQNKRVEFKDFLTMTYGNEKNNIEYVNKDELFGILGGFANIGPIDDFVRILSKVYKTSKSQNDPIFPEVMLRAANVATLGISGKEIATTVKVTSPRLKSSKMSEGAVGWLHKYKNINSAWIKAIKTTADVVANACKKAKGKQDTIQSMMDNIMDDTTLGLTDLKKQTIVGIGRTMLEEGYESAFVAGMLANIIHEGTAGHFESSNYASNPSAEPKYLVYMDNMYNYRSEYSGQNIMDINFSDVYMILLQLESDNWEKGKFGLGSVQWTGERTKILVETYIEIVGANEKITFDQMLKAEGLMISRELSGNYGYIYSDWLTSNSGNLNSSDAAYSSGYNLCTKYEIPLNYNIEASERANTAELLYSVMTGE